jgi:hypothetical protein
MDLRGMGQVWAKARLESSACKTLAGHHDRRRFGYQLVKQRMAFYEAFEGVEFHIAMHNIGGLGIRRLLEGHHEEL